MPLVAYRTSIFVVEDRMQTQRIARLATGYIETLSFQLITQRAPHPLVGSETVKFAIVSNDRTNVFVKDIAGAISDQSEAVVTGQFDLRNFLTITDPADPTAYLDPLGLQRIEIQVRDASNEYLHWEQPLSIVRGHMDAPDADGITFADDTVKFDRDDLTFAD